MSCVKPASAEVLVLPALGTAVMIGDWALRSEHAKAKGIDCTEDS